MNEEKSEDAPRASAPTHQEQREGPHMSPLTPRISRTLHAPASRRAENNERPPLTPRISRTLHAPASRRAESSGRVATCVQNFEDAPHASVVAENNERVVTYAQNFKDAPRASVTRQRDATP